MSHTLNGPFLVFVPVPEEEPVTVASPWWVTIYPGIALSVVQVTYKVLPPKLVAGVLRKLHAVREDEAETISVALYAPDSRYFELRGGEAIVRDARTGTVVLTVDARVDGTRLHYDHVPGSLPFGIYDVEFDAITEAELVSSQPVRLLLRPAVPPTP